MKRFAIVALLVTLGGCTKIEVDPSTGSKTADPATELVQYEDTKRGVVCYQNMNFNGAFSCVKVY